MGSQPVLVLFLKALVAARRSLTLYPAGSEMSTAWIQRLHRSLDGFFQQGLSFPIRIGRDRFTWTGEDLLAVDPTLEALRFDLQTRGVAAFSIDPGVEDWELRAFLELLSTPPGEVGSLAGAAAALRAKSVVHVSVEAPSAGSGDQDLPDPNWHALATGKDELELFLEAVIEKTDERFAELSYDRAGLAKWLGTVADGDPVNQVYSAVKMLGSMAEGEGDREVRNRTLVEALLLLPEPVLTPLLTDRLLPLAGTDLVAFNLLTQVTDDELAQIAQLVPQDQLLALTTELVEFPWEEGKRQRLVEAIATAIHRDERPGPAVSAPEGLARDDPRFLELRQEIVAACHPDALLERSADVLLALLFNVESEEYPAFAVDAIEEIVGEALARGKLDLAVRALAAIGASSELGGTRMREHARHLALFRQHVASRTHVSLVAGLLRQSVSGTEIAQAAEYLRLAPQEGTEEFTTLLADERDRKVRGRMCQVLVKVGRPAVPVLLGWLEDSRWFVVRNAVHVLGRIGDEGTFVSIVGVLDHPHPRVRIEAIHAAGLLGGPAALGPLLRCLGDPDPAIRREVVKTLGAFRRDEAVPALRDLAGRPGRGPEDLEVRREAIAALAAIGTPFAHGALSRLADRRVWFWERTEKRVRRLAADALAAPVEAAGEPGEGDDV